MATSDPATRRDLSQRLVEWLRAMVYDQSLVNEELIESRFKQATDPTTLATIRAIYSKQAIGAMTDFRRENPTPTLSHLSSIEAPALITWGRDDRVNPIDTGLIPMRIIPNGEFHVFPNCGHWVMIECKEAFESLVLSFLKRP